MNSRNRHSFRLAAGSLAGSIMWLAAAGGPSLALAESWDWDARIRVGAGNESELVLTPGQDQTVVPRGGFLDLSPGLTLFRPLGVEGLWRVDAQFWFEHFPNETERSLYAYSLDSEVRWRLKGPWRLRGRGGLTAFDDSYLSTSRRRDLGAEAGLSYHGSRAYLEAFGTILGRTYQNLVFTSVEGVQASYSEDAWSVGLQFGWQLNTDFWLAGGAWRLWNEAVDDDYDSETWSGRLQAGWRPNPGTWVSIFGLSEERDYVHRLETGQQDRFYQIGVAVDQRLGRNLNLTASYGYSGFEQPGGQSDAHRMAVGLILHFGASAHIPTGSSLEGWTRQSAVPRTDEDLLFELEAPEAKSVSLIGDFNDWDPGQHPLAPAGDGRWRIVLRLPAGIYEYAYLVDGRVVTPPEATETVDDGFGGRNGVLRILSDAGNLDGPATSQAEQVEEPSEPKAFLGDFKER